MSIEAMRQALEALQTNNKAWKQLADSGDAGFWEAEEQPFYETSAKAITALRAAIEQAEKQEPHSLLCVCGAEWDIYPDGKEVLAFTAPRRWQGLTDEEIDELALDENGLPNSHIEFARAIEAKLKEKNA